jgi:hypothetical protein
MSKSTKYTFLIHTIVGVIMGLPLLIAPGRWLPLFGWADDGVDALISRVLGAAVLGFAWSSYRGWQAADWEQVRFIVEAEAVFTVLAAVGILRHLIGFSWPVGVWLIFALFAIFAVAWIVALRRK